FSDLHIKPHNIITVKLQPKCKCKKLCLLVIHYLSLYYFFFFNDPATTEIYTLSLHDALPISIPDRLGDGGIRTRGFVGRPARPEDRKSTRLNSSHLGISYAVFCLKKKKRKSTILQSCGK